MNFLFPEYLNIIAFAIVVGQKHRHPLETVRFPCTHPLPLPECRPSQNNRAALPAGEIALPACQKTSEFARCKLSRCIWHTTSLPECQESIGIHKMQAFRCIWPCNALTWWPRIHRISQDACFPMYLALQKNFFPYKKHRKHLNTRISDVFYYFLGSITNFM